MRPESGKWWHLVGHRGRGADGRPGESGRKLRTEAHPGGAGDGVSGERTHEGCLLSHLSRVSLGPRPRRPPLDLCGPLGASVDALSKAWWGPSKSRDRGAAGADWTAVGENSGVLGGPGRTRMQMRFREKTCLRSRAWHSSVTSHKVTAHFSHQQARGTGDMGAVLFFR